MKLYDRTIHELAAGLRSKEFSAVELLESVWNQMELTEPAVKAYLTLTEQAARNSAN